MKRLAWVLLLSTLLAALPAHAADEWDGYATGILLVSEAKVYADKALDAAEIWTIRENEHFELGEISGGWRWVNLDGAKVPGGWVQRSAVDYREALPPDFQRVQVEIISESVTLRAEPRAGARALGTIPNGERAYVLEENEQWFRVRFFSRGEGYHVLEGWIMRAFTVTWPDHLTLRANTMLQAYPMEGGPCVAMLDAGTYLTVIGEVERFWVVNVRGVSAFLRKDADFVMDSY